MSRTRPRSTGASPTCAGFDPDAFGHVGGQSPDVSARVHARARRGRRWPSSPRTGSRSTRAPAEIRFEPLDESHERLGSLVGWEEDKFAAHNAAAWQHGLLVHVPTGVELERPLYVRVVERRGRRLALLAAARRRRGGLALLARRGVLVALGRPDRLLRTPWPSCSSSRARSSSTSRCRTSRARRGTSPRTTRASSATPSSTGSPAASARSGARCGSRTTSPARARPRG